MADIEQQRPVLVVDFGAQYAQLIARRVREAKVYSEVIPHTTTVEEIVAKNPLAVVLSGGPSSVYADGAPKLDPALFDHDIPVFGICYGFQAMAGALGGTVVALLKVTPEQATAYASTAVEVLPIPEGVDLEEGQLMRITDVTEKPPLEEVKSEYAVVGRYLLDPAVFTALENIEPGAGGEYQLTDGYARMIDLPEEQGGGLYGVVIDERRFDTGDKLGYLEANVTLALEDPALGAELKEFLRSKLED